MLFWGCSPQGPTLSDEDRLESVAISSLRYNVPAQVVAAARYSTAVETVQLTNGDWVAELVTIGNPKWDYRRTGSHAFPFEAALALPAQRWITKPCSTKEEAQLASKSNQSFPVDMERFVFTKIPRFATGAKFIFRVWGIRGGVGLQCGRLAVGDEKRGVLVG